MSFGQPLWFWGWALLPVLMVLYARNESRRTKLLRQLVAARLLDRLTGTVSLPRRRLRFILLLLGLAALVTSLARPRYGYTWEQSKRQGRDVLVAIDCSRSMLATDLAPSRLDRAKLATQDLIAQLQGDRVGLIAFAGTAFLQAPLTIDYGAVLNSLSELDTNVIPRGGTNIAAAIAEAVSAFGKGESDNRCLIIFTDGEELEDDAVAAASAEKEHLKIFTVGLGSADGSLIPIPGPDGGTAFVKDENGQIVKSRLDEDRLRKIAESTGGFYVHLQSGPSEMQKVVHDGLGQMKEKEIDTRLSRRPIERYQWPLSAALALLVASSLIGERRRMPRAAVSSAPVRAAAALLLFWLVLSPAAVRAKNSGLEAYEREDYKGAITEFDRQLQQQRESAALNFDLGASAYKSGDFGKALEAFARAVTSPDPGLRSAAEYNLANTLFQQGAANAQKDRKIQEWKDAIEHYDQALKVAPQNKDAEYNRDVVRKLLEELEKEPPKQDQQQPQDQKQDQKQDKKDQKDQKDQKQQQQQQKQDGQKDQKQDQEKSQQQQSQQQQQQQQAQQQQQQSQQQQSQGQQSKDSQGQQAQNQPQQGKDEQAKNEEGKDSKENQPQPQKSGKDGEKKDANQQQSSGEQPPPQPQNDKTGESLKPMPDESGKKQSGQIQAQNTPPPTDPQKEAAAEAEAAQEGKMTEAQAKSLLESLKGEDEHVRLLKPSGKPGSTNFRNW